MTAVLALASAVTAFAALQRLAADAPTYVEPVAGVVIIDHQHGDPTSEYDPGTVFLYGVRGLVGVGRRWEWGMEYARADYGTTIRYGSSFAQRTDTELQAIVGQVRRSWPVGPTEVVGSIGAGLLILDADEFGSRAAGGASGLLVPADVAPPDPEREFDPAFVLSIGLRRGLHETLSADIEGRDYVHACEGDPQHRIASSVFCDHDALLHHFQLTAGLRVEF